MSQLIIEKLGKVKGVGVQYELGLGGMTQEKLEAVETN